ncbi:apoptosis-inducing factor 1, mitochondrial isoform X2 [Daktulosphaira vitifoliae]|uniref:apoptosis-inducing factor 1, mitochondrial isoform X2 n=1 Tax=Daktulosphaira vitifoliae TaxID=58002 RepID=UPI0021AA78BC|nr:apoptosis-inducing factor 1, mitochondrial isoform X2 [Daktulosphaira vitifoliae]
MLSKLKLLKQTTLSGCKIINGWESSVRKYSEKRNGSTKNNKSRISPLIQAYSKVSKPPNPDPTSISQSHNSSEGQNNSNKKQNFPNWILFGGTLLVAGGLYGAWKSDLLGSNLVNENVQNSDSTNKKTRKNIQIPQSSNLIPDSVQYLLIGGGTASFSAFRAIKSADPTARVLVISAESYLPYMRPPLSKELWFNDDPETVKSLNFHQWNGTTRSLFYEPEPFYTPVENLNTSKNGGISIARGWKVESIDVPNKTVKLHDGKEIKYNKCLIATGSTPKTIKLYDSAKQEIKNKFSVFRSVADFEDLWEDLVYAKSVAIIGGGFLGSELAASLATKGKKNGVKIYQIFKENGNMAKVLPKYLSEWTTNKVKFEGIEVVANTEVENCTLENKGKQISLLLKNGQKITVDHVIMAVGAKPNTELASSAGLEVDSLLDGYLVNSELQARTDLYIAGDCACFYDTQLGRRRVEHHDHAVISGRLAGENMAGASKPYTHQPMFWSDIGPAVGYEAIGIIDSSLPTVGVFAKGISSNLPSLTNEEQNTSAKNKIDQSDQSNKISTSDINNDYTKGVIFYLRNDVVVGIVLWNLFNRMSIARQVLKSDRCYRDLNEVAKLFNIHGDASS